MYFEIYPSPRPGVFGQPNPFLPPEWRWRLKGANHEPIAYGEAYRNRRDCIHAVNLLKATTRFTAVRMVAR